MNKKLTLRDFGAEKCFNLLKPQKCPCGCGGYLEMFVADDKDNNVFTVATALLEECDCDNAWIFFLEDFAVSGAHTTEDGIKYFTTATPENETPITDLDEQVNLVKSIIDVACPHCIGVLQQMENGGFRIVTNRVYDW